MKKEEEWQIDNEKNIEKLLQRRLLDLFAIPYKKKSQVVLAKSLINVDEKKNFNKFQVYSLQMQ